VTCPGEKMRLAIDLTVESVRMAERGEATPEDIDTAMELGTGHREYSLFPKAST
jgi:3-hydroxyacyl-CoA dehydrogenase